MVSGSGILRSDRAYLALREAGNLVMSYTESLLNRWECFIEIWNSNICRAIDSVLSVAGLVSSA